MGETMIKRLMQTKKLKTHWLANHNSKHGQYIYYDSEFDALLLLIVPPSTETVVHYIDDQNVALVYEPKSREIVGIQVEAFLKSFLPKHIGVQKVWQRTIQAETVGDLILKVQEVKPAVMVAQEVIKASHSIIGHEGTNLASLLNKSFSSPKNYAAA